MPTLPSAHTLPRTNPLHPPHKPSAPPHTQPLSASDLDSARIRALAALLGHRLGCALFGVDILHSADSDTYYVVRRRGEGARVDVWRSRA